MNMCLEARLVGRRVLLLSPHADDIAYSIGGTVARLAPLARLRMLTVFARSGWALPVGLRREGVDAITRVRRTEDEAFCARHDVAFSTLDLDDSYIAGYDDHEEVSIAPGQDPRTETAIRAITDFIRRDAPDALIAPAAIGGHVDHRIVHLAARRIEGVETFYYEDIPYSADQTLAGLESFLAEQGLQPVASVDIDPVIETKTEGMWGYRSQVCAATVVEMLMHAERVGTGAMRYAERLWSR